MYIAFVVVRKAILLLLGPKLSGSHVKRRDGLRLNRQVPVAQCALLSSMFSHYPQFSKHHCSGGSGWLCPLHTSEAAGPCSSHLVLFLPYH